MLVRRVLGGRESGQATTEYVALLSVVAVTVAAVVAALVGFGGSGVTDRVREAGCVVASGICSSAADAGASSVVGEGGGDSGESAGDVQNASAVEDVGDSDDSCDGWRECAWSGLKQVGSGGYNLGKGAFDDVKGAWDLVTHPGDVDDAVGYIVDHPVDAARQLVWDDESAQMWSDGDIGGAIGRTTWNTASWFIPGYDLGKGVSKVGKLGKLGKAEKAAKAAEEAAKAEDLAADAGKASGKDVEAAEKDGNVDDAPVSCANSFAPATRVLLGDGSSRRIDRIEVGDTVRSTDPVSGRDGVRAVEAVLVHKDTELTNVVVRDASGWMSLIRTTPQHPFWNQDTLAWTDAESLEAGNRLRGIRARGPEVVSVRSFTGLASRYNLTVARSHTFYVLSAGSPVLVHNASAWCPSTIPEASLEVIKSIEQNGVISQSGVSGPAVPREFKNDGRSGGTVLPSSTPDGSAVTYREWGTISSPDNPRPGGERIVTGSDGSIRYSADHYQTFIRYK